MKLPRRWRWLLGMSALALFGPWAIWLAFRQHAAPARLEDLLPDRLGGALCLSDMRLAWNRHWLSRPTQPGQQTPPRPEDALRAMLEALEKWDKWEKNYGAAGAELRLQLYQDTLFQALGSEAWLLFGEWLPDAPPATPTPLLAATDPAAPAAEQAGLLLLLRTDSAVKRQVGPLMDLAIGGYSLSRTRVEGYSVYTYTGKTSRRSLSFCQVEGWICASLRQGGLGPLPLLLHRLRQAQGAPQGTPASADLAATRALIAEVRREAAPAQSALAAVVQPEVLLGQIRKFYAQQDRRISRQRSASFVYWEQRLHGIERLTLLQHGDSLFDLDLMARGPRAGEIAALLRDEAAPGPPTAGGARLDEAAALRESPAEVLQLDLSLELARNLAPLAGDSWEDWLHRGRKLRRWVPGLLALAQQELGDGNDGAAGRLGLAAFPGASPLIPGLLAWKMPGSRELLPGPPAQYWRARQAAPFTSALAPTTTTQPTSATLAAAAETSGGTSTTASLPMVPAATPSAPPAGELTFWVLPAAQADQSTTTHPREWLAWTTEQWNASASPTTPASDRPSTASLTASVLTQTTRTAEVLDRLSEVPAWPAGFLTLNFGELRGLLGRIPPALLKKDGRRSLERWQRTLHACDLAAGGLLLRIDEQGPDLALRLRTP